MPLTTPRQIAVCKFLRRHFYARTTQIRDAVVPEDRDGSSTREVMRSLLALGYVRRHEPRLLAAGQKSAPPIYVLTIKGSCALAAATRDVNDILTAEPTFKDWMSLNHYCAMATLHAAVIDAAFARQDLVKQYALYYEHELIDPSAEGGAKYRLHTVVSKNPPVFCCPDSALETEFKNLRRVWFVEREMGTDTPERVAAKKCKGYAGMNALRLYTKLFPQAKDMRVLAFCPYASFRTKLLKALKGKPGAELWLACDAEEVNADNFLHGPVFWTVDRGPLPFVPAAVPALVHASGGRGG